MAAEPIRVETPADPSGEMLSLLEAQRRSFLKEGPPPLAKRLDRLDRCIRVLLAYEERVIEALSADFGHRSADQSLLTDIMASVEPLRFARKNVAKWMKPDKRSAQFPLGLLGAKAEVRYQPLGVVGVISPWNFPVNLTFAPLAGILAAGNRTMIKPSEFTPETSALMAEMFESAFDPTEICVINGGPEVGQAFSGLPFDHLLFTGATGVARHVMRAAADNLVPVTLELGGKSPVVVGLSAQMPAAAKKIMAGKMLNAGQICLAPDYVFVPEGKAQEFAESARQAVAEMYPGLKDNDDYTSVINARHQERLAGYLEDARTRGAEVVELNPGGEDFAGSRKMAPALVLQPDDDSAVMQNEIFGPVLPIKTYGSVDEVIDYVNARPRPLAIYYFGNDAQERERLLARTTSGGVTVNDVLMHVTQEDLPFGGVGPSGTGSYHGRDGFLTFSHARSVFTQAKIDVGSMLRPPYGKTFRKFVRKQVGG